MGYAYQVFHFLYKKDFSPTHYEISFWLLLLFCLRQFHYLYFTILFAVCRKVQIIPNREKDH